MNAMAPRMVALLILAGFLPAQMERSSFSARPAPCTLRPAGLEESSPEVRDDFLRALDWAGLESSPHTPENGEIALGWRALRQDRFEETVARWGNLFKRGRGEELARSLEAEIPSSGALSQAKKARLEEGLNAVDYALNDPSTMRSLAPPEKQAWQSRFDGIRGRVRALSSGRRPGSAELVLLEKELRAVSDERERVILLRTALGFSSPHALEQEAGLAYATVSRFEQGQRGLGREGRHRLRSFLEKRTRMRLTFSFRPIRLPLEETLNPMRSADDRYTFIQDELLGWPRVRLARLSRTYSRAPLWVRRRIRARVEQGLSEWLGAPVVLDGRLAVPKRPAADRLRELPGVRARLTWLLEEVLLLPRGELGQRVGWPNDDRWWHELMESGWLHRKEWDRVCAVLSEELAARGEPVSLDSQLLPARAPSLRPVTETVNGLLDGRIGWKRLARAHMRGALMQRFEKPESGPKREQVIERAQILAGLLGEVNLRRQLIQNSDHRDNPARLSHYVPANNFMAWLARHEQGDLPMKEALGLAARDHQVAFPNDPDPAARWDEIRETLRWMAEIATRTQDVRLAERLQRLVRASLLPGRRAGLEQALKAELEELVPRVRAQAEQQKWDEVMKLVSTDFGGRVTSKSFADPELGPMLLELRFYAVQAMITPLLPPAELNRDALEKLIDAVPSLPKLLNPPVPFNPHLMEESRRLYLDAAQTIGIMGGFPVEAISRLLLVPEYRLQRGTVWRILFSMIQRELLESIESHEASRPGIPFPVHQMPYQLILAKGLLAFAMASSAPPREFIEASQVGIELALIMEAAHVMISVYAAWMNEFDQVPQEALMLAQKLPVMWNEVPIPADLIQAVQSGRPDGLQLYQLAQLGAKRLSVLAKEVGLTQTAGSLAMAPQLMRTPQIESALNALFERPTEGDLTAGLEGSSQDDFWVNLPGSLSRRRLFELAIEIGAAAGISKLKSGADVLNRLMDFKPSGFAGETLLERLVLLEDIRFELIDRFAVEASRIASGQMSAPSSGENRQRVAALMRLTGAPHTWFEHRLEQRLKENGILSAAETVEASAWNEIHDNGSDWNSFQERYVPDPEVVAIYRRGDRPEEGILISEECVREDTRKAFVREKVVAAVNVSQVETIAGEVLEEAASLLRVLMHLPEHERGAFQKALEQGDLRTVSKRAVPALQRERQELLWELRGQFSYENRLRDEWWQFTEREVLMQKLTQLDLQIAQLSAGLESSKQDMFQLFERRSQSQAELDQAV